MNRCISIIGMSEVWKGAPGRVVRGDSDTGHCATCGRVAIGRVAPGCLVITPTYITTNDTNYY